jgi:hypothetical protein
VKLPSSREVKRLLQSSDVEDFPRWSDVRADIVAEAGGEEAVAKARKRNQAYIDDHRIADARQGITGMVRRYEGTPTFNSCRP